MRNILLLVTSFTLSSVAYAVDSMGLPFSVTHMKPTGKVFDNPPFEYMHYYRTEVRNNSKRPLKIIWFEGYLKDGEVWYPGNVLGRALRGKEFSAWYTEGAKIQNGIIMPGQVAVCDVNWHGSNYPEVKPMKWSYIAVDSEGNDFFIEAEVPPNVVFTLHGVRANQAPNKDAQ